jgi:hypothetical protein
MSFPFSFCPPVTITETVPGLLTKTVSGEQFAYGTEVQNCENAINSLAFFEPYAWHGHCI